jgi:hypothetical protein
MYKKGIGGEIVIELFCRDNRNVTRELWISWYHMGYKTYSHSIKGGTVLECPRKRNS